MVRKFELVGKDLQPGEVDLVFMKALGEGVAHKADEQLGEEAFHRGLQFIAVKKYRQARSEAPVASREAVPVCMQDRARVGPPMWPGRRRGAKSSRAAWAVPDQDTEDPLDLDGVTMPRPPAESLGTAGLQPPCR